VRACFKDQRSGLVLSFQERPKPSGVVGMVVSRTILGFPDSFDMTQIFVVLSLTSAPIVVQYTVFI
jgi:hypothetical protein